MRGSVAAAIIEPRRAISASSGGARRIRFSLNLARHALIRPEETGFAHARFLANGWAEYAHR